MGAALLPVAQWLYDPLWRDHGVSSDFLHTRVVNDGRASGFPETDEMPSPNQWQLVMENIAEMSYCSEWHGSASGPAGRAKQGRPGVEMACVIPKQRRRLRLVCRTGSCAQTHAGASAFSRSGSEMESSRTVRRRMKGVAGESLGTQ